MVAEGARPNVGAIVQPAPNSNSRPTGVDRFRLFASLVGTCFWIGSTGGFSEASGKTHPASLAGVKYVNKHFAGVPALADPWPVGSRVPIPFTKSIVT